MKCSLKTKVTKNSLNCYAHNNASSLPGSLCCQGTSWSKGDKSHRFFLYFTPLFQVRKIVLHPTSWEATMKCSKETTVALLTWSLSEMWTLRTLSPWDTFVAKGTEFLLNGVTLKKGTMLGSYCYVFLEQMCTAFKLKLDIWKSKSYLCGLLYYKLSIICESVGSFGTYIHCAHMK